MLLDPLEHEIAELLAAAGDRARSSHSAVPDRAFSTELRDRMMTAAGDRATDRANDRAADRTNDRASDRASDRARVRLAWSLPSFFRVPGLLPVALASLLLIAGVVAARELYVAIGDRPDPTPTPVPSVESVAPSESLSVAPSTDATLVPVAVATPDHTATQTARPKPTTKPTPTPSPTAAPTPGLVAMNLAATGCEGGVVLSWSPYDGDFFDNYTTLRNTTSSIPKAYPPQGGAVEPGGTHATNPGKTSAVDAGASPGTTYYYRTMAFNADDGVIGASSVVSAVAAPVGSLGSLSVGPDAVEGTDLTWTPYAGPADCFTWYKLVYSDPLDPSPSYLDGDPYLAAISDQGIGSYTASSVDLPPGSYNFRVQAIRGTDLGVFIVAQTDVVTYPVP